MILQYEQHPCKHDLIWSSQQFGKWASSFLFIDEESQAQKLPASNSKIKQNLCLNPFLLAFSLL
jgi:hypothetical protein